jgi:predicted dehydrogenase
VDRLRWVIVGCGHPVQQSVALAMLQDKHSKLVGFCGASLKWAEQMRQQFGADWAYDCVEAAITDEQVDAVYVTSPVVRHCAHAVAAADAGKHVMCEAPMASSVAECRAMITAANALDVHLSVAYYRRFWPTTRLMKQLIRQGRIGQPLSGRMRVSNHTDALSDDATCTSSQIERNRDGALLQGALHGLDLMCHLLGTPEMVMGMAQSQQVRMQQVEDTETLLCRLHTGAYVICEAHWNLSRQADEFEVRGSEGTLIATSFDAGAVRVLDCNGDFEDLGTVGPEGLCHQAQIDDFTEAITEGRAPAFDGYDGMMATGIAEAAYRSRESGRWEAVL